MHATDKLDEKKRNKEDYRYSFCSKYHIDISVKNESFLQLWASIAPCSRDLPGKAIRQAK